MKRFPGVIRHFSTRGNKLFNYYDVLGVKSSATTAEIKMAYYQKTKLYHPDKVGPSEENLRKFRQISEAYEVLGNNISRKTYDEDVLGISSQVVVEEEEELGHRSLHFRKEDNLREFTRRTYSELRMQQKTDHAAEAEYVAQGKKSEVPFALRLGLTFSVVVMSIFIIKREEPKPEKGKHFH